MSRRCTCCLELTEVHLAVTRDLGTCWLCEDCDEREYSNESSIVEVRR